MRKYLKLFAVALFVGLVMRSIFDIAYGEPLFGLSDTVSTVALCAALAIVIPYFGTRNRS